MRTTALYRPGSSRAPLQTLARTHPRGVSLIEALVALAIMSFGMLALVGVQATMRYNSDIARQRTEATRLATENAESARFFATLDNQPGQVYDAWDDLSNQALSGLNTPGNAANTSFNLTRTVNSVDDVMPGSTRFDAASMKVLQVQVEWVDRVQQGARAQPNQLATLDSVISAVDPVLSARLVTPSPTSAASRRGGRHASIPVTAQDLGNGSSAYKPFNLGSTVWVMDHATGYVTSICTGVNTAQTLITTADLNTCNAVAGRLVSGLIGFDLRSTTVTAAAAEAPAGPQVLPLDDNTPLRFATSNGGPVNQSSAPQCVANNPNSPLAALARTHIAYACVVFPADSTGWGGKLDLVAATAFPDGSLSTWQIGNTASQYRVCRYTTASGPYTANSDHPATYCQVSSATCSQRVTQNLSNQNFLVISAVNACPTDQPINPAAGDLVNSNTLQHQP